MATAYASVSPSFRTPEWRPIRTLLFVGMGLSAVIPVVHGYCLFGYKHLNDTIGLNWLVLQGVLYIVGAGLYAGRIPEKFFPGKFDIYFSSHQIFHFLVVAAAVSHLRGLLLAFHSKHSGPKASVKVFESRKKIE
jgi:adiponectin receptor